MVENPIKVCGYQYYKAYRMKNYHLIWPKTGEMLTLNEALERKLVTEEFHNHQTKKVK